VRIDEDVPLSQLTTLRVGGPARRVVRVHSTPEVLDAVSEVDALGHPLLIVGGGSNLVVSDRGFDGTVVHMATRGIHAAAGPDECMYVTSCAGEPWDAFVEACVMQGWSGVECLSGIAGSVGAVPMQNVGAYGQEVSDTIASVRVWDRGLRREIDVAKDQCDFGYRRSVFRGRTDRVVLSVTFRLMRSALSAPLRYPELARALDVTVGARLPLERVRSTVMDLRRAKGMVLDAHDHDTWSAGSFFVNPVVGDSQLRAVRDRVEQALGPSELGAMPAFADAGGRTKLSAAWLIERAGFPKGFARGAAAISSKHALALTNRGGATASDVVALARHVRDGVDAAFGVRLEPEPIMVGICI